MVVFEYSLKKHIKYKQVKFSGRKEIGFNYKTGEFSWWLFFALTIILLVICVALIITILRLRHKYKRDLELLKQFIASLPKLVKELKESVIFLTEKKP